MSEPSSAAAVGPPAEVLDVHLAHRIHPGLTLEVDLRLGREIGVVFGPSGAGKTSLLRLIAGLTRPDSGRVRLGDDTLFDATRGIDRRLRDRRIGMIFQDDWLFPHLNVAANIRFGLQGMAARGGRRPVGRGRGALRRGAAAGSFAGDALGRRAAAGRPGAGAGAPAPAPALRRAGLGARPGQSPRDGPTGCATSSAPRRSRCSTSRTASPRPSPWARGCSCWSRGGSSPRDRRWTCWPPPGGRTTVRSRSRACSTSSRPASKAMPRSTTRPASGSTTAPS